MEYLLDGKIVITNILEWGTKKTGYKVRIDFIPVNTEFFNNNMQNIGYQHFNFIYDKKILNEIPEDLILNLKVINCQYIIRDQTLSRTKSSGIFLLRRLFIDDKTIDLL